MTVQASKEPIRISQQRTSERIRREANEEATR